MSSNIKILKGPYSDIWRNQYDIKEHSDGLYDLNMWGCDITWNQEQHWIVPPQTKSAQKDYTEWFRSYKEYRDTPKSDSIILDINKAIELYNLKQQLSPNALKTFGDLIEEL